MKKLDFSAKVISYLLVLLAILLLTFILVGTVQAQGKKGFDPVATRKAIEKNNAGFMAAIDKGDAEAMVKGYTKDAIVMPPNEPAAEGTEAIKKSFMESAKMGKINLLLKLNNVIGYGNLAVATGTYEIAITPEGKESIKDNGKYVNVWQMQKDGNWKLIRDIWNSDIPQTAPQQ